MQYYPSFNSIDSTMIITNTIKDIAIGLIDILLILLPVLLSVAFMTIIERKQLAAMQRRVGPNTTGVYGVLQPFLYMSR